MCRVMRLNNMFLNFPQDKVLRLKYKNFTFPKMYTQITNEEKKTTFKKYSKILI